MLKILIVDDESIYFDIIKSYLQKTHDVFHAKNKSEMYHLIKNQDFSLILMDWDLTFEDGSKIAFELKQNPVLSHIPVIMLTGRNLSKDMENALFLGADDYITKPFELSFLKAKIFANIRTFERVPKKRISNDIVLNEQELTVYFKEFPIQLTDKEFKIVNLILKNPDKTFSRKEINALVNESIFVSDRTIDTFVAYIRKKFYPNKIIKTIPKKGYKLFLSP